MHVINVLHIVDIDYKRKCTVVIIIVSQITPALTHVVEVTM